MITYYNIRLEAYDLKKGEEAFYTYNDYVDTGKVWNRYFTVYNEKGESVTVDRQKTSIEYRGSELDDYFEEELESIM